jgi:hypothetical protein
MPSAIGSSTVDACSGKGATWIAGAAAALIALAACTPKDAGYVEIKTVPVVNATAALYLDSVKLDPLKNGSAVLRQSVGTAKLAIDGALGKLALCDIVVRKEPHHHRHGIDV